MIAFRTDGGFDLLHPETLRVKSLIPPTFDPQNPASIWVTGLYSSDRSRALRYDASRLEVFEIPSGRLLAAKNIELRPFPPTVFDLFGASNHVIVGAQTTGIFILDESLNLVGQIPKLTNELTQAGFYVPCLDAIAAIGFDGTLRVCDPQLGLERRPAIRLFTNAYTGFSATHDGSRALFCGGFGSYKLLELNSGTVISSPSAEEKASLARSWPIRGLISPDGTSFVLIGRLGFLEMHLPSSNKKFQMAGPKSEIRAAVFSQDSQFLFIAGDDGIVRQFTAKTAKLRQVYGSETGGIRDVVLIRDGNFISVGGDQRLVHWDTSDDFLVAKALNMRDLKQRSGGADYRFVMTEQVRNGLRKQFNLKMLNAQLQ
jgi:WD40 repeat protein